MLTILLSHHQQIRELCTSRSHALGQPPVQPPALPLPHYLVFKNALLKHFLGA